MRALVDDRGEVEYGCLDEPLRFNIDAFRLRTFFGGAAGPLRRRMALGGFTFLGILAEDFMVGLAAVRLGYVSQVFGWLYDFGTGTGFEIAAKALPGRLAFPMDPDAHAIRFDHGGCRLSIDKSHALETLDVDLDLRGQLRVQGTFGTGFRLRPLRVVNPSCGDPDRFTFTEKVAPLRPERLSVIQDGVARHVDLTKAVALCDWTAGYFNRHTNWLWSAFGGILPDGTTLGANFAALVNESFYPENAFWIDGARTRLDRVIFRYDREDPYREPWRIHTEDGRVDLRFRPLGERGEKTRLPFLKVNFRQFMGTYSGTLRDDRGRTVELGGVRGLAEIHLSVW